MSIIQDVLDGNWSNLKTTMEKKIANKVMGRVEDKKVDVLASINGVSRDQMEQMMSSKSNQITEDVDDDEEVDEQLELFVDKLKKEIDGGTYWEDAFGVVKKDTGIDHIKTFGFDQVEERFKEKFGKEPAEWMEE